MKRNISLDNVACLMILHMMIIVHAAHICGLKGVWIDFLMNTFVCFLPWFFFKAGMFFKDNKSLNEELLNGWHRLIIPFLIFSALGWLIITLGGNFIQGHHSISFLIKDTIKCFFWYGLIRGNAALWFLLSLFLCRICFAILTKLKVPAIIILCCSLAFAIFFNYSSIEFPYFFGNVSNGIFFFSLGYLLKVQQYKKWLFIFAMLIFIYQFFDPLYLDFRSNKLFTDRSFLQVEAYCLASIIFFNNLFKYCFNYKIPILTHIGENTMTYYAPHYIILLSVDGILSRYITNSIVILIICIVILIIALYTFEFIIKRFHLGWTVGTR